MMEPVTRVIIVTGASSGIGEATARLFGKQGWAVVLAARSAEKIKSVAEEIVHAGGSALAVTTDVTNWGDVDRLVQETLDRFGRIDVLVNNAGKGLHGTIDSLDLDTLEYVFRLNVVAPVALMQVVTPAMREQGGGVIVNVSSVTEHVATPFMGGYAASKSALSVITDAARAELDAENIAVVNVTPGSTETSFGENSFQGGTGVFDQDVLDALIRSNRKRSVPAARVAETIWSAVLEHPRRTYVTAGDAITGELVRLIPGSLNRVMTRGLTRYMPRKKGDTPDNPLIDLAKMGVSAGAALGVAMLVRRLWTAVSA